MTESKREALSARYKDAMLFAARLHDNQVRKSTEIAYLTHLMSVSALVLENGGSEDEGIGALLHDALEDQGEDYKSEFLTEPHGGRDALKRDIELKFGSGVLAIVIGCSDDEDFVKPPKSERGSIEAWRSRKEAYLAHVAGVQNIGILRVSCADKLHNARTILLDRSEHGEEIFKRFRAGSKEAVLWYYESLAQQFKARADSMKDNVLRRLSSELVRTVSLLGA